MEKFKVGIIGCTGMVGQRYTLLLKDHPWYEVTALAASARSAGRTYREAVDGRWKMDEEIPAGVADLPVYDAEADIDKILDLVDFVFCAVSLGAAETVALENLYASRECPVMSCNKAHRWTPDVPMLIPEVNADHAGVVEYQRKRLGTKRGFIAVKPNCSIQGYVPPLTALLGLKPTKIAVCTYQAISGAGKTFKEMPEMVDNVIPYIGGEEEKSEREPLKLWGKLENGVIIPAEEPLITAQCIRVPVTDGHMAAVFVDFAEKTNVEEMIAMMESYRGRAQELDLPSAPKQFIHYFREDNRPQTKLDRDLENGMAVSVGRLRPDTLFDYKFVGLAHNTLRGAAGGSVLATELLTAENYITRA
jgi:aspartate-semialdehyde dehydrogenase